VRPEERERREEQRLAAMARNAADLGELQAVAGEVEEKALAEAELQLHMRCNGCRKRIGVGLVFSRFEVTQGPNGRPIVNRMKVGACNGAEGCDFAAKAREGADLMEMVEFVWLTGEAPVGHGTLEGDVDAAQSAARSTATPEDPLSGGPDLG
jgi:hypothetical protein